MIFNIATNKYKVGFLYGVTSSKDAWTWHILNAAMKIYQSICHGRYEESESGSRLLSLRASCYVTLFCLIFLLFLPFAHFYAKNVKKHTLTSMLVKIYNNWPSDVNLCNTTNTMTSFVSPCWKLKKLSYSFAWKSYQPAGIPLTCLVHWQLPDAAVLTTGSGIGLATWIQWPCLCHLGPLSTWSEPNPGNNRTKKIIREAVVLLWRKNLCHRKVPKVVRGC